MGQWRRDGQCSGWEVQCGRRTKINWTKTAHHTRICTCIGGHLGLVPIHTHTHRPLCGYGLSTGPTEGLSSWWSKNQSSPSLPRQTITTTKEQNEVAFPKTSSAHKLHIRRHKLSIYDRHDFPVAAQTAWNSLPGPARRVLT